MNGGRLEVRKLTITEVSLYVIYFRTFVRCHLNFLTQGLVVEVIVILVPAMTFVLKHAFHPRITQIDTEFNMLYLIARSFPLIR